MLRAASRRWFSTSRSVHAEATLKPHVDVKRLRDHAPCVAANIALRKGVGDTARLCQVYSDWVAATSAADALRKERKTIANTLSLSIEQRQQMGYALKAKLEAYETQLSALRATLDAAALQIPCDSHPCAPVGPEEAARVVYTHGAPREFDFQPRDHVALGTHLGLFDTAAGAAVAGAGFVVLKNHGVLLEQALINWALARAMAAGFSPIAAPDVAYTAMVEGCGFNPRPSAAPAMNASAGTDAPAAADAAVPSQVYSLTNSDLCLVGTSEISLAALHANSIMSPADLPATYCAVSHCFRREAGSRGQRDRGLYRLHQFSKVELFAYAQPDIAPPAAEREPVVHIPLMTYRADMEVPEHARTGVLPSLGSEVMFQRLVNFQASLYAELGLHYRVLDMPTEELGASAYRKVDIEAWMPGRGSAGDYGEISSASNCIDYQARRLNIRFKAGQNDNRFVHTLNATACAVPRLMLSILETHQRADGSVVIPPALVPYMHGITVLHPPAARR